MLFRIARDRAQQMFEGQNCTGITFRIVVEFNAADYCSFSHIKMGVNQTDSQSICIDAFLLTHFYVGMQ